MYGFFLPQSPGKRGKEGWLENRCSWKEKGKLYAYISPTVKNKYTAFFSNPGQRREGRMSGRQLLIYGKWKNSDGYIFPSHTYIQPHISYVTAFFFSSYNSPGKSRERKKEGRVNGRKKNSRLYSAFAKHTSNDRSLISNQYTASFPYQRRRESREKGREGGSVIGIYYGNSLGAPIR